MSHTEGAERQRRTPWYRGVVFGGALVLLGGLIADEVAWAGDEVAEPEELPSRASPQPASAAPLLEARSAAQPTSEASAQRPTPSAEGPTEPELAVRSAELRRNVPELQVIHDALQAPVVERMTSKSGRSARRVRFGRFEGY